MADRFGNHHGSDYFLVDPSLAGTGAAASFSAAGNLPVIFRAGVFDITNRLRWGFSTGHSSIGDPPVGTGPTLWAGMVLSLTLLKPPQASPC